MSGFASVPFDGAVYHPDSVLAAAHVLARRFTVTLKPDGRGGPLAAVEPAAGVDVLRDEAAAQELRRRIAAANRTLREYVVTRSLLSAGGSVPVPEERGDLEGLIAEAERQIAEKAARFEQEGELERIRAVDPEPSP